MIFGIPSAEFKIIVDEIKSHLGQTTNPRLYIFGSRAKGKFREYSDIDLLLKADHYDLSQLKKIDFSELYTAYKVDFVIDPDLHPPYRDEIYSSMKEIKFFD